MKNIKIFTFSLFCATQIFIQMDHKLKNNYTLTCKTYTNIYISGKVAYIPIKTFLNKHLKWENPRPLLSMKYNDTHT